VVEYDKFPTYNFDSIFLLKTTPAGRTRTLNQVQVNLERESPKPVTMESVYHHYG
jgi:hypothetical protein